ncbi:MAG: phage tail protein [Pyrinomonadaceae bacterium]
MSDPFVAEIRMFGFNFAPTGWAQCNGQILPISQNTALFSLLGTMYGGNGQSTFALPNLEGSVPLFWGQGQGLSLYDQGQVGGSTTVTLLDSEMPIHSHNLVASEENNNENGPADRFFGAGETRYAAPNNLTGMSVQALTLAGASFPHNNLMPFLVVNFCIAMQGIFPPRS